MNKGTQKKKKYTYNQDVIKALVEKHGFTAFYIRQCLSGYRNSLSSDKIKADYKELESALKQKIEEFKHQ